MWVLFCSCLSLVSFIHNALRRNAIRITDNRRFERCSAETACFRCFFVAFFLECGIMNIEYKAKGVVGMRDYKSIKKEICAGERKPPMPSPKRFVDRKKQARKNACRVR